MLLGTSSLVVGVGITLAGDHARVAGGLLRRNRDRWRRIWCRLPGRAAQRVAARRPARARRRAVGDLCRVLPRDGVAGCRRGLSCRARRVADDGPRVRRRGDGAWPRSRSSTSHDPAEWLPDAGLAPTADAAITWPLRVRDGVRARYTGARRSLLSRRHGGEQRDGEPTGVRRTQSRDADQLAAQLRAQRGDGTGERSGSGPVPSLADDGGGGEEAWRGRCSTRRRRARRARRSRGRSRAGTRR